MAKANDKPKAKYEKGIINSSKTYEKPFDMAQIPVFTIENCEVLFSSLTSETPQYGHSVTIMLPAETDFVAQDKLMRSNFLKTAQQDNPNLEVIKGAISLITNKDVLAKKYPETLLNRHYVTFTVSNSCMLDKTVGEDGKDAFKRINKVEEAKGEAVVKYFRAVDQFSGEGINPEVFKYENGEKVKTFISPKTKEETPLYVGKSDIVNIKIRPFATKNQNTGDISWRYNLLSLEIVQTAWDRGIGRKGGSNQVCEAPEAVSESALSSIFAGIASVSTPAPAPQPQPAPVATPAVEQVAPAPAPVAQPAVQPEPQPVAVATAPTPEPANEVPAIDFGALANLNIGNVNLGE